MESTVTDSVIIEQAFWQAFLYSSFLSTHGAQPCFTTKLTLVQYERLKILQHGPIPASGRYISITSRFVCAPIIIIKTSKCICLINKEPLTWRGFLTSTTHLKSQEFCSLWSAPFMELWRPKQLVTSLTPRALVYACNKCPNRKVRPHSPTSTGYYAWPVQTEI